MADGTIGYTGIVGGSYDGTLTLDNTYLLRLAATGATISGKLYKIDIAIYDKTGLIAINIKVFRDDGTNYNYIGGVAVPVASLSVGNNYNIVLSSKINVKIGDLIGFYGNGTGGSRVRYADFADGTAYKAGEISGNTVKTDWTKQSRKPALLGYISPILSGALNWWFCKESWEKHDKIFRPKLIIPKLGYEM